VLPPGEGCTSLASLTYRSSVLTGPCSGHPPVGLCHALWMNNVAAHVCSMLVPVTSIHVANGVSSAPPCPIAMSGRTPAPYLSTGRPCSLAVLKTFSVCCASLRRTAASALEIALDSQLKYTGRASAQSLSALSVGAPPLSLHTGRPHVEHHYVS
jgi:hypothetical protein